MHGHCRQEAALGADLVHRRSGRLEFGLARVERPRIQVQVVEPRLGAVEHPEPDAPGRHADHRVDAAVDQVVSKKASGTDRAARQGVDALGGKTALRRTGRSPTGPSGSTRRLGPGHCWTHTYAGTRGRRARPISRWGPG